MIDTCGDVNITVTNYRKCGAVFLHTMRMQPIVSTNVYGQPYLSHFLLRTMSAVAQDPANLSRSPPHSVSDGSDTVVTTDPETSVDEMNMLGDGIAGVPLGPLQTQPQPQSVTMSAALALGNLRKSTTINEGISNKTIDYCGDAVGGNHGSMLPPRDLPSRKQRAKFSDHSRKDRLSNDTCIVGVINCFNVNRQSGAEVDLAKDIGVDGEANVNYILEA